MLIFKLFPLLILFLLLCGCSNIMKSDNFNYITAFILKYGNRATYCNKYNHNPHYQFNDFHVFLNPDIGQRNINCDPELSGFDEIVIQHNREIIEYYRIKIENDRLIYDMKDRDKIVHYFKIILEEIKKKT